MQLVQELGEGRLGVLDLPVVLGSAAGEEQCHRPVVALGRHRIEHLLRPASLHLRIVELDHAIVHLPDDEEAEQPIATSNKAPMRKPKSSLRWTPAFTRATASTTGRSQPVKQASSVRRASSPGHDPSPGADGAPQERCRRGDTTTRAMPLLFVIGPPPAVRARLGVWIADHAPFGCVMTEHQTGPP